MHNPFLVGARIYLRGLREEDLTGPYFQWFNDADVCQFNDHGRFPNTTQAMHRYFESISTSRDQLVLAIVSRETDEHIGNIALQKIDWISRSAEFAILVGNKAWWGKKIGYEAGTLLINHALTTLNLRRIYCGTHEQNIGMQRLAVALGMQPEGRRVQAIFKNGKYCDILEYGLIKN